MDYKVQKNSQNNDMASLVNDVCNIIGFYLLFSDIQIVNTCVHNLSWLHLPTNLSIKQMFWQCGNSKNLHPAEDIKKVERRVASNEKKIEKTSSKLPKKVE